MGWRDWRDSGTVLCQWTHEMSLIQYSLHACPSHETDGGTGGTVGQSCIRGHVACMSMGWWDWRDSDTELCQGTQEISMIPTTVLLSMGWWD